MSNSDSSLKLIQDRIWSATRNAEQLEREGKDSTFYRGLQKQYEAELQIATAKYNADLTASAIQKAQKEADKAARIREQNLIAAQRRMAREEEVNRVYSGYSARLAEEHNANMAYVYSKAADYLSSFGPEITDILVRIGNIFFTNYCKEEKMANLIVSLYEGQGIGEEAIGIIWPAKYREREESSIKELKEKLDKTKARTSGLFKNKALNEISAIEKTIEEKVSVYESKKDLLNELAEAMHIFFKPSNS